MDINQYLGRIQFNTTPITPDYITLEALVEHHQLHIPFENIDIQNRIPIRLDTACFYEKIIVNNNRFRLFLLNFTLYNT